MPSTAWSRPRLLEFAAFAGLLYLAGLQGAWAAEEIATLHDLKYSGTVPQTTDYSCGAAAIACLLDLYYGLHSSERGVLELAEQSMRARREHPGQERGLTAYDLRAASEALGMPMVGYRVDLAMLEDFFGRGGLPILVHVTTPRRHYLVIIGLYNGYALVADPAWGRCIVPTSDLAEYREMSGVVLVPLPDSDHASHARTAQAAGIAWMKARLVELGEFRETIW